MKHYKFFQNRQCEYFPCHDGANPETFNCLFCYCPLYPLKDQCGGNVRYLENGVKDCSGCLKPHGAHSFELIMDKMPDVLEVAKITSDK